jgi:hypothetical protein
MIRRIERIEIATTTYPGLMRNLECSSSKYLMSPPWEEGIEILSRLDIRRARVNFDLNML